MTLGFPELDLQSRVSGLDMEEGVVFFAFAEEEVLIEEEVGRGDMALGVGFLGVVDVGTTAFDIFTGLAFGVGEFGFDEEFG
ncbi:MAG: hypothetical protein RI897_3702 [Verrucomicrobiota bacterium]